LVGVGRRSSSGGKYDVPLGGGKIAVARLLVLDMRATRHIEHSSFCKPVRPGPDTPLPIVQHFAGKPIRQSGKWVQS